MVAAPFSPIMIEAAFVLPVTMRGIIDDAQAFHAVDREPWIHHCIIANAHSAAADRVQQR